MIRDLQKVEIGQRCLTIPSLYESTVAKLKASYSTARLDSVVNYGNHIERYEATGGVRDGSRGARRDIASISPSYTPQNKLLPAGETSRYSKRDENAARGHEDGGDRRAKRRRTSQLGTSNAGPPFACPYYCFNKKEHQHCLGIKLSRLSDVRQHIKRCHTQLSYCARCGKEFQDDPTYAQRDAHVQQHSCEATSPVVRRSWATSEQLGRMEKVKGGSGVDRWYGLWDILFPHHTRPRSPYVDARCERSDTEVRAAVERYRENGRLENFSRRHGLDAGRSELLKLLLEDFCECNRIDASTLSPHVVRGAADDATPKPQSPTLDESSSIISPEPNPCYWPSHLTCIESTWNDDVGLGVDGFGCSGTGWDDTTINQDFNIDDGLRYPNCS
ncbi:hypothetical protein F5Y10DRAFT_11632 [Nemania abortiva]|nr:hypothetical protein F5Y10DRAFT_11632 [Nemania abortiva]